MFVMRVFSLRGRSIKESLLKPSQFSGKTLRGHSEMRFARESRLSFTRPINIACPRNVIEVLTVKGLRHEKYHILERLAACTLNDV